MNVGRKENGWLAAALVREWRAPWHMRMSDCAGLSVITLHSMF